jgi:hypothetical protein
LGTEQRNSIVFREALVSMAQRLSLQFYPTQKLARCCVVELVSIFTAITIFAGCVATKQPREIPRSQRTELGFSKVYGVIVDPANLWVTGLAEEVIGLELEVSPVTATAIFMLPLWRPFPNELETDFHRLDHVSIIRGAYIGIVRAYPYRAYGLDLSVTGSITEKIVHGWSLSLMGQDHIELKGVATAVIYNRGVKCRGLQVSLFYNRCDDLKGVQIGFINKNQKRALPFINFAL